MRTTRRGQTEDQPGERAVHGLDLPEHGHLRGLWRVLRGLVQNLLHVGGHGAEIAALSGAVDLDHGLDVVVRIDRGHRHARDVGDGAERLRRRSRCGDRQVAQRVQVNRLDIAASA